MLRHEGSRIANPQFHPRVILSIGVPFGLALIAPLLCVVGEFIKSKNVTNLTLRLPEHLPDLLRVLPVSEADMYYVRLGGRLSSVCARDFI